MSVAQQVPPGVIAALRQAGCVFAEDEARLLAVAARGPGDLDDMVRRRAAGLPLAQVLGWAEFCGQRIAVDPGVFVPRPRSEFLVRQAIAQGIRPSRPSHAVIVDLCCGSGALGAAVAAAIGMVELHAADIDRTAVACARRNVADAGGRVYQGDLFGPLPARLHGRVDLILANVPYVPSDDLRLLPHEARLHEPRLALDGGADGLDVLRRVAGSAPSWLAPGGHLLSEVSARQAASAAGIMASAGLIARVAASAEWESSVVIGAMQGGAREPLPPARRSQADAGFARAGGAAAPAGRRHTSTGWLSATPQ
jgi:release factor glutamine methyltransferase